MESRKYLPRGGDKGYGKTPFILERTKNASEAYPKAAFKDIVLWILMSSRSSIARRTANAWVRFIQRYLVFRISERSADYLHALLYISVPP